MTTPTEQAAPAGAVNPSARAAPPMECRAADLSPATFKPDDRTVELTASAGAVVRRRDWWSGEDYDEQLVVSAGAVDLTRFEAGSVPLLNTHGSWDLRDILGTTVPGTARFESGALILTVRFSGREDVAPYVQDVADGIIRNVSVGYRILAYEVDETTKPKTRRITRWELLEVSMVPVGADGMAGTRSMPGCRTPPPAAPAQQPVTVTVNIPDLTRAVAAHPTTDNTEIRMSEHTEKPAATQEPPVTENRAQPPAPPVAPVVDLEAIRKAEMERIGHIRSRAAVPNLALPDDLVQRAIASGMSVADFNNAVVDFIAERQERTQPHIIPHVQVTRDEGDTRNQGMVEHLLTKVDKGRYKPTERSADFRGMQVRDIAREILDRRGIAARGLTPDEVIRRAMTTSDLPYVLGSVTRRTLLDTYNAVTRTFTAFARETSLTDFRATTRVSISSAPQMLEVKEDGEIKAGAFSDQGASINLKTYARSVLFSRQALVNDDLGALLDLPMKFAASAARTENSIVWGLITGNPVMGDGKTLFHADHNNLAATGTALSVTTLGAAETALGLQKSFDGEDMDLQAKYMLLPRELRAKAATIVEKGIKPTKADDVTPGYLADIIPISESRLSRKSATAWYLVADPMMITGIEYAYMEGSSGLQFSDMERVQGKDGMVQDFWLDFGAAVIDYRAFYKNAGA